MINVIQFSDEDFETQYVSVVEQAYSDAQNLLPDLPATINIRFTDNGADSKTGVGGFTVSDKQINIAVLKDFHDRDLQNKNLRGVFFHESFHVQQGFTFDKSPFTALESAIYEGCAVIFERQQTETLATYANYSDHTDEQLQSWLNEIHKVGNEYFEDTDVWHKWAFYHPEYDQKWIIYKVGTWLVDNILKENNLDILDLKDKSAAEITKLIQF